MNLQLYDSCSLALFFYALEVQVIIGLFQLIFDNGIFSMKFVINGQSQHDAANS